MWTCSITQELIVILRTGLDVIAQVIAVDTHSGVATLIQSWTHVAVAFCLIFVMGAVVDPVTAYVNRQTVATWTQKVCFSTAMGKIVDFEGSLNEESIARKVKKHKEKFSVVFSVGIGARGNQVIKVKIIFKGARVRKTAICFNHKVHGSLDTFTSLPGGNALQKKQMCGTMLSPTRSDPRNLYPTI